MLKEESLKHGKNGIGNVKNNSIGLFSNRQSRATAERLERYRYDAESGRLRQREPGGAYDYDAGGRTTADGRLRYRYGAQGRLAEITRAATGQRRAAYRYNALGERVRKSGTSVTYYHYDLEGRLLAETDAGGQTRAEYLYLGNEPLALSRSGQLYYYHNDHLGTPQKLTDGAGQVVWSASYRAFGEASIQAGYVTRNLRFPGQYYDEESGLHYNCHRYYGPDIGRYLTSDPIGLAGGVNTYLYANANPIRFTDPLGLKTYQCRKPLDAMGGSGTRSGPDTWGNPFYHQYSCVIDSQGKITCGGQDRTGSSMGSPGKPSNDSYKPKQCEKAQDDNQCFEQCMIDEWAKPRPWFGIPFGTDCQEYDDGVHECCRKKCGF